MKRFLCPISYVGFVVGVYLLLAGCSTPKLEAGGAYATSGTNVVANTVDYGFFVADSAFDLAFSTVDAAFKFERDNRTLLWQVSPNIKHTLDSIRPQAAAAAQKYAVARNRYLSSATSGNLTAVQTALAEMQRLANAAQAALPATK